MIKHILICSSAFLVIVLTVQGYADEHFPFLAQVSKDSVNVRAGSNTNFEKIDKLSRGTKVVVTGRSYEWYKIQPLPTTKAYIRSDYLQIKEGGLVAAVLGDRVNVRSSPNSDAASLGQIKKGALVVVLEQVNGWCRLAPVAGTAAWIHHDFLQLISADVPASMFIKAVEWAPRAVPAAAVVSVPTIVPADVSLRGVVEPLGDAPGAEAHYALTLDGKAVYYLQDMPHIDFFAHTVVDVKGTVVLNPHKKCMYPLLHINKISLVL